MLLLTAITSNALPLETDDEEVHRQNIHNVVTLFQGFNAINVIDNDHISAYIHAGMVSQDVKGYFDVGGFLCR